MNRFTHVAALTAIGAVALASSMNACVRGAGEGLSEQPPEPSPEFPSQAAIRRGGSTCFNGSLISLSSPNRLGSIELAMPVNLPSGDEVVRVAWQPGRRDGRIQRHLAIEGHSVPCLR
jgi:hypothetical protein